MKRLRFLIPIFALSLVACNEGIMTEMPVDPSSAASVKFSLSADMRNDLAQVKSGAEEISVDDFWVEIFNSSKMRIFCVITPSLPHMVSRQESALTSLSIRRRSLLQ